MKYTLEERIERARALHKKGYNCSQCVVMVFDDVHGLSDDVAARVSAGFGSIRDDDDYIACEICSTI